MFKKYPPINHILIVGRPASYKDITAVRFCHQAVAYEKKIFFNLALKLPSYYITDREDFNLIRGDVWNPAICYIHDFGSFLHGRDFGTKNVDKIQARKDMVNNYRKRGIQIIGTIHREHEIDIEVREACQYFVYPEPKNMGDKTNMEDDVVLLRWYDKPEEKRQTGRPIGKTYYVHPERYARLFDTLEENTL